MTTEEARKFLGSFVYGGLHDDPKVAVQMFQDEIRKNKEMQKIIDNNSDISWDEVANYKVTNSDTYKRLLGEGLIILNRFDNNEVAFSKLKDGQQADKNYKKQIVKELREKEKQAFINSLPMAETIFRQLFVFLDEKSETQGCNHALELTVEFLQSRNIDAEPVIEWLHENGAYCDCEVIFNIEELFAE